MRDISKSRERFALLLEDLRGEKRTVSCQTRNESNDITYPEEVLLGLETPIEFAIVRVPIIHYLFQSQDARPELCQFPLHPPTVPGDFVRPQHFLQQPVRLLLLPRQVRPLDVSDEDSEIGDEFDEHGKDAGGLSGQLVLRQREVLCDLSVGSVELTLQSLKIGQSNISQRTWRRVNLEKMDSHQSKFSDLLDA